MRPFTALKSTLPKTLTPALTQTLRPREAADVDSRSVAFGSLLLSCLFALTLFQTPTAEASTLSTNPFQSADYLQHNGGDFRPVTYGYRGSRYSNKHRYSNRRQGSRWSNRSYRHNGYRYSAPRARYSRGCDRVVQRSYWNGRRALVGGKRCVNSRGYSYVVPSSRYFIRYR